MLNKTELNPPAYAGGSDQLSDLWTKFGTTDIIKGLFAPLALNASKDACAPVVTSDITAISIPLSNVFNTTNSLHYF